MPHDKKHMEKIGKDTQFNGETAAKAGRNGARVANEKKREKKRFLDYVTAVMDKERTYGTGNDAQTLTGNEVAALNFGQKIAKGDLRALELYIKLRGEMVVKQELSGEAVGTIVPIIVKDEETRKALADYMAKHHKGE